MERENSKSPLSKIHSIGDRQSEFNRSYPAKDVLHPWERLQSRYSIDKPAFIDARSDISSIYVGSARRY